MDLMPEEKLPYQFGDRWVRQANLNAFVVTEAGECVTLTREDIRALLNYAKRAMELQKVDKAALLAQWQRELAEDA